MEGVEEIALPRTVSTVAVIGAEPSGLATARRLLEAGLNVTVFERKREAGPYGMPVSECQEDKS